MTMRANADLLAEPRIQAAVTELQDRIRQRYPSARFSVSHGYGDDYDGVYIRATVDVEDTDEVLDLVIERLVDMQVEEELPINVIPVRPLERIAAMLRDRQPQANGDQPSA
jgi:hypothetical protein